MTPPPKRLLSAAFVAPMDGPMLRDAGVLIVGDTIVAVGPSATLRAHHPDAAIENCGCSVLLPGLVNAHAHLELTDCSPLESLATPTFTDWIVQLRPRLRVGERTIEDAAAAGVRLGVAQCLRFGTTTIGDISQQHHVTRPLLRDGPLRVVSYGEALGLAAARPRFESLLETAVQKAANSRWLRVGLSPHAPYTVDLNGYRQCLQLAEHGRLPLATHLAETPEETTFLTDQSGPFRTVWEKLGAWADGVETFSGPPIPFAHAIGLLDHPALLAHVNYCDDSELALLSGGRASVVYCPRTHAFFGHPPHRWREMLAAGINVAVGTDSCASSPDLNLVDDLRLIRRAHPEVPATALWELVTVRAAKALQMDGEVGRLTAGSRADVIGFPVQTNDPLEEILLGNHLPNSVWIDGARIG